MKNLYVVVGGCLIGCWIGTILSPSSGAKVSVDSTNRKEAGGAQVSGTSPIESTPYQPSVQNSGKTDLQRWREMGEKTNVSARQAGEYLDLDSRLGVKYGKLSRSDYEKWTGKKYVEPTD